MLAALIPCLLQDGVLLQYAPDPVRVKFDNDLDSAVKKLPYSLSGGADTTPCQNSLGSGQQCPGMSAQTATYQLDETNFFELTLCLCEGGPYDANGLANLVSGIPDFLIIFIESKRLIACQTLTCALYRQAADEYVTEAVSGAGMCRGLSLGAVM